MTKPEARRYLIGLIKRHVDTLPVSEQIKVYQALALIAPTDKERKRSDHMAWLLTEQQKHQYELFTDLFQELSWPGHDHNGEPQDDHGGAA